MKEKFFLKTEENPEYTSYSENIKNKPNISIEELEELCGDDEILNELLEDVLNMCLRYTETVLEMNNELLKTENGVKTEGYREISANRGRIHDTTIESIDIFARALRKAGKRTDWVEDFKGERSAYGRFAILITLSRLKKATN